MGSHGASTVDPEQKAELTPVLECFAKKLAAVSGTEGALTLIFTDGALIEAPSHEHFEAMW
jgi:hypothetical protein